MTLESNVWRTVRRELSPFGRLLRIENRISLGTPDVIYCLRGVAGWIETKATPRTLTLEQVIFAEAWGAFMPVHTLLHAGRRWALYDPGGTRTLYSKQDATPVVSCSGKFPTKEVLRCLSPNPRASWTRSSTT